MSGAARVFDVGAFIPRAVEVEFSGVTHRIPGSALTAELVFGLQEAGQAATEGDTSALGDIRDLLTAVVEKAAPPLDLGSIPPAALGPLTQFLLDAAGADNIEESEPDPPTRRRRASSATTRSKPSSGSESE